MSKRCVSTPGLTFHNPHLTPLAQVEGGMFPVTTLIVPRMPHRQTTKMLQVVYSGKPSGEMRRRLGDAGEEWVATLLKEKLHGDVRVATKVLVHKGSGRSKAGDLDVVVYVPGELLVVIEVKWHIKVNSHYDALYQQNRARKGRRDFRETSQKDGGRGCPSAMDARIRRR